MPTYFHEMVIKILKRLPKGKVATYGQIAALSGSPRSARQIVRILHSSSRKEKLPWHRVINKAGKISLKPGEGYEEQKTILLSEGIIFDKNDSINLKKYLWKPRI